MKIYKTKSCIWLMWNNIILFLQKYIYLYFLYIYENTYDFQIRNAAAKTKANVKKILNFTFYITVICEINKSKNRIS